MKIKKIISFSDKKQIWRILISKDDKLLIETRDTEQKLVFFNCFDLNTKKRLMKNFQLEEKFWVGIEAFQDGIIYFHHFAKPNMPEHKKIIAYSLSIKNIIWQNEELTFLSLVNDSLYAIKRKFEGQQLFSLNPKSGQVKEELGSDTNNINSILHESDSQENFSNYKYPELLIEEENIVIKQIIDELIENKSIVEKIDFLQYEDLIFFNYYEKSYDNSLDNKFVVYNIVKKKKQYSELINKNLNSISPDTFFCYKGFLFLLKNKIELVIFNIL